MSVPKYPTGTRNLAPTGTSTKGRNGIHGSSALRILYNCWVDFQHTLVEHLALMHMVIRFEICFLGVPWSHLSMVLAIKILRKIISQSFLSWVPLYIKVTEFSLIYDTQNLVSIDRERCLLMISLAIPAAVTLSQ